MADSIAEMVDNLDIEGGSDGISSPEPKGSADKDPGDGASGDGRGATKPGDESGDKGATDTGSGGDGKSDSDPKDPGASDDGYVADEAEDEPPASKAPDKPGTTPSGLSPELEYVVGRLPILTVHGREGGEGQVKSYQVKAAGQLPENFEFTSKREELIFTQSLASQELKAQQLLNEFNYNKQQETSKQYDQQENADIRSDMGDLQREGKLAKFKYPPSDRRFNDDPAVKEAQAAIEYMNDKNATYTKAGKLYRISFRDAFEQLQRADTKTTPEAKAQGKEDADRKQVSRQTGAGRSASATPPPKARIARNMEDLISRIDTMEFS